MTKSGFVPRLTGYPLDHSMSGLVGGINWNWKSRPNTRRISLVCIKSPMGAFWVILTVLLFVCVLFFNLSDSVSDTRSPYPVWHYCSQLSSLPWFDIVTVQRRGNKRIGSSSWKKRRSTWRGREPKSFERGTKGNVEWPAMCKFTICPEATLLIRWDAAGTEFSRD